MSLRHRAGRPARRHGARRGDERGLTLVELMVAMAIFSIVMVISGSMLRGMTQATVRVSSTNEARTEVDRLYNRLDKQVPYAAVVNRAVLSGGDWWLEFRTDVPAGGLPPRCWQYHLDTTARVLEARTWPVGAPAGVSGWTVLAQDAQARTGTAAPAPFQMIPSTTDVVRQRLVVALDVAPVGAPLIPLDTTFVARNTTPDSVTNSTGTEVCREVDRT